MISEYINIQFKGRHSHGSFLEKYQRQLAEYMAREQNEDMNQTVYQAGRRSGKTNFQMKIIEDHIKRLGNPSENIRGNSVQQMYIPYQEESEQEKVFAAYRRALVKRQLQQLGSAGMVALDGNVFSVSPDPGI